MTFPNRLREARERRKLNQTELAAKMGCQPSAIGHMEKGRREPSLANLRKLALALNVSADYLLEIFDNESKVNALHRLQFLTDYEIVIAQKVVDAMIEGRR